MYCEQVAEIISFSVILGKIECNMNGMKNYIWKRRGKSAENGWVGIFHEKDPEEDEGVEGSEPQFKNKGSGHEM